MSKKFFSFEEGRGELPLPRNPPLTFMIITIFSVSLEFDNSEVATFENEVL